MAPCPKEVMMMATRTVLALILAGGLSAAASAQESHDAHHPADTPPQAAAPATPAQTSPQGGQQGMAGGTMMGAGMMGSGMSGDMMPMMPMMRMMMAHMSEMSMPGMDMADRIEGRIAFLRTELKITDAQQKPWNDFAQTLRENARKLGDMRSMMAPNAATQTVAQRLEQQEKWYTARLEGIRALKGATSELYSALSDEQKKTADQILPPHLGLMPMMPMAMMSMGGNSR
jgi:hypothetical protein